MSEEQQNQSQGIVGEIVEGLHNLEQKVETFLHPAASDSSPSSTEPAEIAPETTDISAGGNAAENGAIFSASTEAGGAAAGEPDAGAAGNQQPSDSSLPAVVDAQTNSADPSVDAPAVAASGEASATSDANASAPESSQPQQAISGADAPQYGAAASDADTTVTDAASLSAPISPSSDPSGAATTGASDDPNAAAPTAGDSSENVTQSSASPVSQVGVGLAIAASVSEAVASRVYVLRRHFWTFDEAARAPFIKLLDEIEALVK